MREIHAETAIITIWCKILMVILIQLQSKQMNQGKRNKSLRCTMIRQNSFLLQVQYTHRKLVLFLNWMRSRSKNKCLMISRISQLVKRVLVLSIQGISCVHWRPSNQAIIINIVNLQARNAPVLGSILTVLRTSKCTIVSTMGSASRSLDLTIKSTSKLPLYLQ